MKNDNDLDLNFRECGGTYDYIKLVITYIIEGFNNIKGVVNMK